MKTQLTLGACALATAGLIALGTGVLRPDRDTKASNMTGLAAPSGLPGTISQARRQAGEPGAPQAANGSFTADNDPQAPSSALSPFLQKLQSALASATSEEDDGCREEILNDLEDWMANGDLAAALEFLNAQEPTGILIEMRDRVLRRWAQKDPGAAADAALGPSNEHRQQAVNAVMGEWADRDLEAAVVWAGQLPEGKARQDTQMSVAREAARTQPQRALEIASELEPSAGRDDLAAQAAAEWAARDPDAAAAWAREATDGPLRERLLAAVATAMGEADPRTAAGFAIGTLPPGRARNDALVGIVQRWVQTDPQAAAGWVARFPEGVLRNDAVENLVKLWASQNPGPPATWIASLPAGPGRDSAIRAYAEQIAAATPARAAAWAGSIADATLRQQQSVAIAELWMRADPAAASAWIQRNPFPPQTKTRLLAIHQ